MYFVSMDLLDISKFQLQFLLGYIKYILTLGKFIPLNIVILLEHEMSLQLFRSSFMFFSRVLESSLKGFLFILGNDGSHYIVTFVTIV